MSKDLIESGESGPVFLSQPTPSKGQPNVGVEEVLDYLTEDVAPERARVIKSVAKAQLLAHASSCKPDIDKHFCPFNDGEQVCPCFAEATKLMEQSLREGYE